VIALVQGPPGAGKSFYAMRKLAEALESGKPVATNVELAPDAYERIAGRNFVKRPTRALRLSRARELERGTLVTDRLEELFSVRLRGRGEGRGVMVLDEAHNWINAREWSAEDRRQIVRWFTQHRKLGWDVYLISQDIEMIDKQVRTLGEYVVSLRNLKRAKWGPIPFSPVNLFLAVWRWHAIDATVVKRELYRLNYAAKLYDTYATSHGLAGDELDDALWLPRPAASDGPRGGPAGASPDPAPTPAPPTADVAQLVHDAALGLARSPAPTRVNPTSPSPPTLEAPATPHPEPPSVAPSPPPVPSLQDFPSAAGSGLPLMSPQDASDPPSREGRSDTTVMVAPRGREQRYPAT
jgi:Zonular occludens toxin (Zot)